MDQLTCIRPSRTASASCALARPRSVIVHGLTLLFASGCAPELPASRPRGAGGASAEDPGVPIALEPPSSIDAAPPILRARFALGDPDSVDLARVFLVEGELGPAHLKQIEKGELSSALSRRLVPALSWIEADPDGEEGALVVAPLVQLALGGTYAFASGDPAFAAQVHIAPEDAAPRLDRVWPPVDGSATFRYGIWCGADDIAPFAPVDSQLAPAGMAGVIAAGAVDGIGQRCVRFNAAPGADAVEAAALVGPPSLSVDGGLVRLDPRPFTLDVAPTSLKHVECAPSEARFGPGCVRVEDDRLFGRSPIAPLLWAVRGAGLDRVFVTAESEPFVLTPLPPATSLALDVAVVDQQGTTLRDVAFLATLAPMAHIVINEVLANPLGSEPAQEWVELINDGSVPANLAGYVLEDIGGKTELPDVELSAGSYALLVNDAFAEDDELDPTPAARTVLVRVPKLGKGGLSNSGEPLKLRDASGAVVSRAPVGPRLKPGSSLARTVPYAPDGLASSFAASIPTPGAPNFM